MSEYMTISARVNELVNEYGSLRAVAEQLVGCSPEYLSQLRAGHRRPSESILQALGLTLDSAIYKRIRP